MELIWEDDCRKGSGLITFTDTAIEGMVELFRDPRAEGAFFYILNQIDEHDPNYGHRIPEIRDSSNTSAKRIWAMARGVIERGVAPFGSGIIASRGVGDGKILAVLHAGVNGRPSDRILYVCQLIPD